MRGQGDHCTLRQACAGCHIGTGTGCLDGAGLVNGATVGFDQLSTEGQDTLIGGGAVDDEFHIAAQVMDVHDFNSVCGNLTVQLPVIDEHVAGNGDADDQILMLYGGVGEDVFVAG